MSYEQWVVKNEGDEVRLQQELNQSLSHKCGSLSSILRHHIVKTQERQYTQNSWDSKAEIPRTCWQASLTYLVSSRLAKDCHFPRMLMHVFSSRTQEAEAEISVNMRAACSTE